MPDAICDTGPILHLHEIGCLKALGSFDALRLPNLVVEELRAYGLDLPLLASSNLQVNVTHLQETEWSKFLNEPEQPVIHAADAQVLALAHVDEFHSVALTDDLALRRRLEQHGATVAGSIGVLVRSHSLGQLSHNELAQAIDALFTSSSLHLSRGFRAYIQQLIADLK
jgi:predicted nucleic acid-binding protein